MSTHPGPTDTPQPLDIAPHMAINGDGGRLSRLHPNAHRESCRQGLGSGSAPHSYYLMKKRPTQGRFGLLLVPPGVFEIKDFLVCDEIELIR